MAAVLSQIQQLSVTLAQAVTTSRSPETPPPPPPSAAITEPRVGTPERYAGDPDGCNPFITNCSILYALQPLTFSSEAAKVAFTINHLTGRARLWGTAEWEKQTPACASFQAFSAELRKVFRLGFSGSDAAHDLLSLQQGNRTVADFSIDFRTRARQSCWNESALRDLFLHSLADYIKDELVSHEPPSTLDGMIELAIRVDLRIQARRRERRWGTASGNPPTQHQETNSDPGAAAFAGSQAEGPEPMQLGCTSLSPKEKERRRQANLCLYCGRAGHFISRCPAKARAHQ
ncbi:hypothetical protein PAMP_004286 [Pampus punctatissimus]